MDSGGRAGTQACVHQSASAHSAGRSPDGVQASAPAQTTAVGMCSPQPPCCSSTAAGGGAGRTQHVLHWPPACFSRGVGHGVCAHQPGAPMGVHAQVARGPTFLPGGAGGGGQVACLCLGAARWWFSCVRCMPACMHRWWWYVQPGPHLVSPDAMAHAADGPCTPCPAQTATTPGEWKVYCNVLDHVAAGMMLKLEVRPAGAAAAGS